MPDGDHDVLRPYDEFSAINTEILGVSVDSKFAHLAWIQTERNAGGLGDIAYPLVSDLKKEIADAYSVLTDEGVALRGLFIIDKEGIVQHATINNEAFGRPNLDETLRHAAARSSTCRKTPTRCAPRVGSPATTP